MGNVTLALTPVSEGIERERYNARLSELGVKGSEGRTQVVLDPDADADVAQLVRAAGSDLKLDPQEVDKLKLPRPQTFGIRWPTSHSINASVSIANALETANTAAEVIARVQQTASPTPLDVLDALQRFSAAMRKLLGERAVAYASPVELLKLRTALLSLYKSVEASMDPKAWETLPGRMTLQQSLEHTRDANFGLENLHRIIGPTVGRPIVFSFEATPIGSEQSLIMRPRYAP